MKKEWWLGITIGVVGAWLLPLIGSTLLGWSNCGKPDCPMHGHLNEPESQADPQAEVEVNVEISRDVVRQVQNFIKPKPKPKHFFQPGEIVEHFEIGECVVNGHVNTTADIPIYQINWYEEEANKRHHNFQVWETELKKVNLPDYPKPQLKPNLERDLELQMIEERIEKAVHERLQEQERKSLEVLEAQIQAKKTEAEALIQAAGASVQKGKPKKRRKPKNESPSL